METQRKSGDYPLENTGGLPKRQSRHTFEVHLTGVPTGSQDPAYRWHGDFEHRHKGKCKERHNSSRVDEIIKILVERIRKVVGPG